MRAPDRALRLLRQGRADQLAELAALVRFRSVSGDPDVRRCARALAACLPVEHAELVETGGPPLVVGRSAYRRGLPYLLIYGHYDVQPAPARGWRTPPFTATVNGSSVVGRGVSDNKGPLLAHVRAARALLRAEGRLPVNVTYLFDGEEEVGSPHLPAALERLRLRADLAVVSDTRMLGPARPALVHGLRGSVNVVISISSGAGDLHAGAFGGRVRNPAHVLADLVSSLHDGRGRIAVPGFRAEVRSAWEPAISVTRLAAGSAVTAIPGRAAAGLNLRLVPDQTPAGVVAALREHLVRAVPDAHARVLTATPPVVTSTDPEVLRPAVEALRLGFGREPVLTRSGGSIPAVGHLQDVLGVPVVLMGFTLADDHIHAPNERIRLSVLWRATDACLWLLRRFGARFPA